MEHSSLFYRSVIIVLVSGIIAGLIPGIFLGFWLGQNFFPIFLAVIAGPLMPFFYPLREIPLVPALSLPLTFTCYFGSGYLNARLTGLVRWGMTSVTIAAFLTLFVEKVALGCPIVWE